jgi:hypothetical protein
VQIPVVDREVVNPATHEIGGEEHGHFIFWYSRKSLLEDLEASILSISGGVVGEEYLCIPSAFS